MMGSGLRWRFYRISGGGDGMAGRDRDSAEGQRERSPGEPSQAYYEKIHIPISCKVQRREKGR